jgi:hypothetical protein
MIPAITTSFFDMGLPMRRLSSITLNTLLILFLAGNCYAISSEGEMLAAARDHFNGGRYYFATTWLERILKSYPASANRKEVLTMAVKAYALSGREDRAAPYLTVLAGDFPGSAKGVDLGQLKAAYLRSASLPATAVADTPEQIPAAIPPAMAVPPAPVATTLPPAAPPRRVAAESTVFPVMADSAPPAKSAASMQPAVSPNTSAPLQTPPAAPIVPRQADTLENATTAPPVGGKVQGYCAVAGESSSRHKIDALAQKLRRAGLQAQLRETTRDREVYRLIIACSDNRDTLEQQLAVISRKHRDAFIFRDEQAACIAVGSFFSEKAAAQGEKLLTAKGLHGKISRYTTPLTVWQAIAGCFPREEDGAARIKQLAARGVAATLAISAGE